MHNRTMLLVLAVTSGLVLAFSAAASGQEQEIDPGAGTAFTGHAPGTFFTSPSPPTLTCETTKAEGEFTTKTTGTIKFDSTLCHIEVFGFTTKCHTFASPLDYTVFSSNVFHSITINNKPGMLLTPPFPKVTCGSTTLEYKGNGLIGTFTSPSCAVESKTAVVKFEVEAGKQKHMTYTGVNYDMSFSTSPTGTIITTGVTKELTLNFASSIKMTCQ